MTVLTVLAAPNPRICGAERFVDHADEGVVDLDPPPGVQMTLRDDSGMLAATGMCDCCTYDTRGGAESSPRNQSSFGPPVNSTQKAMPTCAARARCPAR